MTDGLTGLGRGRSRKRFGQHFLEPAWVDKVVRAIAPQPDETFLEIGPGPRRADAAAGRARASACVAFEIDRDLAAGLRASRSAEPHGRRGRLPRRRRRPTPRRARLADGRDRRRPGRRQPALQRRLADPVQARRAVTRPACRSPTRRVMLQREVADRLLAAPGSDGLRRPQRPDRHIGATSSGCSRCRRARSGRRRRCSRRSSGCGFTPPDPPARDDAAFAGARPGGLHAAAKDARERAARLPAGGRGDAGRGCFATPASTARRRPETLTHRGVRAAGRRARHRLAATDGASTLSSEPGCSRRLIGCATCWTSCRSVRRGAVL